MQKTGHVKKRWFELNDQFHHLQCLNKLNWLRPLACQCSFTLSNSVLTLRLNKLLIFTSTGKFDTRNAFPAAREHAQTLRWGTQNRKSAPFVVKQSKIKESFPVVSMNVRLFLCLCLTSPSLLLMYCTVVTTN